MPTPEPITGPTSCDRAIGRRGSLMTTPELVSCPGRCDAVVVGRPGACRGEGTQDAVHGKRGNLVPDGLLQPLNAEAFVLTCHNPGQPKNPVD